MGEARPAPTAYDVVPYPSRVQLRLHPERTATIARLLGVELADVRKSRVLELGCGNGLNLASMALASPESHFVGVDLASQPITSGRELLAEAKIGNVELLEGDIASLSNELGTFDYVISHGVYSWIPPEARDALLAACKRFLAPRGIAYVSYAVYPGCHVRELVRDMMLIHTDGLADPLEKVKEGITFVGFIKENQSAGAGYRALLEAELERLQMVSPEYLFHDDFSTENAPVYFGAFIHHARGHGLDFFSESHFSSFSDANVTPELKTVLSALAHGDIAVEEQYMDFLKCRGFRQTLLCHQGATVDRTPHLERVFSLCVAGDLQATSSEPKLFDATSEKYRTSKGLELSTPRPLLKVMFGLLGEAWPMSVPVETLWHDTNASLRAHGVASAADDREAFARTLVQAAGGMFVDLGVNPPTLVKHLSERPVASPLARAEARRGSMVTNLRHASQLIDDAAACYLLTLLDGSRTRPELLRETRTWLDRAATGDPKPTLEPEWVDHALEKMARLALLRA